jgi:hypothetical protein
MRFTKKDGPGFINMEHIHEELQGLKIVLKGVHLEAESMEIHFGQPGESGIDDNLDKLEPERKP